MKRNFNSQKSKSKKSLPLFVTVCVIVLLVIQVIVSNSLATNGIKISQMDTDIQDLQEKNSQLQETVASAAALMTVKEKAVQLGFVKSKPIFLESGAHVARLIE